MEFDTDGTRRRAGDVLVIGSGIAGLTAAMHLAAQGLAVHLVTKAMVSETSTWHAQGGIAAAVGEADSSDLHLADTIAAGQGLCDEPVVRAVVEEAQSALDDLTSQGVRFDLTDAGGVDLHREGGHSLPRILHSGDSTGAEVQATLSAAVRSAPNVTLFEERFLVDLLTAGERCVGALIYDPARHELETFWAGAVVLATGGTGQLFKVTTNPSIATGDGVAAAWRAGADIADLEFVQFHPTALDSDESPKFLISEALRGEGAQLLDCRGERFMVDAHQLAELAPRDVVTREMERVMAECETPNVWLDARHLGADRLAESFPMIMERCLEAGFDLATDRIPVAPAAHYMIGGVHVDLDGRSSLPGLYSSGEVTASGLHGANRLASNSLLEGLVFSRRIARAIPDDMTEGRPAARVVSGPAERSAVFSMGIARETLQSLMSSFVGTSRSAGSLAEAAAMLDEVSPLLEVSFGRPDEFELQNMISVASLLTHAAWFREESRGVHFRSDHPDATVEWRVHVVWRRGEEPRKVRVDGGRGAAPDEPTDT